MRGLILMELGDSVRQTPGIFRIMLIPAEASRAAMQAARPAVYQSSGGAQVASPQSPILPLKHPKNALPPTPLNGIKLSNALSQL